MKPFAMTEVQRVRNIEVLVAALAYVVERLAQHGLEVPMANSKGDHDLAWEAKQIRLLLANM